MGPTTHSDASAEEKGEAVFNHKDDEEAIREETAHEAAERGNVATDKYVPTHVTLLNHTHAHNYTDTAAHSYASTARPKPDSA
jgi:hypothetical protein